MFDNHIKQIISYENLIENFQFSTYQIFNPKHTFFNNSPNELVKCEYCKKKELKHKQFGNHLDKCKSAQIHRTIKSIFTNFSKINKYFHRSIDLTCNYNNYENVKDALKELHYYEDASYYINNEPQQKMWRENLDMWEDKVEELNRNIFYINQNETLLNQLKMIKNDKQFINKYYDEAIFNITHRSKYHGVHNHVLDTIENVIKSYTKVNEIFLLVVENYYRDIKELYDTDILKMQSGDCGICIEEKKIRKTFCCNQSICGDCTETIKKGNSSNTDCPFCRNNHDW